MKVELIQATENTDKLIADIASICYGKDEAENPQKLLEHLCEQGHLSPTEHAYYTFEIDGVSRVLLGQLTRHRLASFTVRSQRYCDESDIRNIMPLTILNDETAKEIFESACIASKHAYKKLVRLGIPKEDARYVTLQAGETNLYFSCNFREVLHIAELRTSEGAQWEIRNLTNIMIDLILEDNPQLEIVFRAMEKMKRINTKKLSKVYYLISKVLSGKIEHLQEAREAKEKLENILTQ